MSSFVVLLWVAVETKHFYISTLLKYIVLDNVCNVSFLAQYTFKEQANLRKATRLNSKKYLRLG